MALIFTVPALIKEQGLVAMLIKVECCALARYQVGVMHVPMNIAMVMIIVCHCFCRLSRVITMSQFLLFYSGSHTNTPI